MRYAGSCFRRMLFHNLFALLQMFYQTPKRTIRTKIRWLLKAPESANDTIEQKQQRQDKYKDLLIISAPVKDDIDAESSSVLCLITLPEDEHQDAVETTTMPQTLDEQLTLKLDMNGAVTGICAFPYRVHLTLSYMLTILQILIQ